MAEQIMTEEEAIARRLLWIATILWIVIYLPITICICFIDGVNRIGGLGNTVVVDQLLASRACVSDRLWGACQKYGMDNHAPPGV